MDRSYTPKGWNTPDASKKETAAFLNITSYSSEDILNE
jgi:hypothetical protein